MWGSDKLSLADEKCFPLTGASMKFEPKMSSPGETFFSLSFKSGDHIAENAHYFNHLVSGSRFIPDITTLRLSANFTDPCCVQFLSANAAGVRTLEIDLLTALSFVNDCKTNPLYCNPSEECPSSRKLLPFADLDLLRITLLELDSHPSEERMADLSRFDNRNLANIAIFVKPRKVKTLQLWTTTTHWDRILEHSRRNLKILSEITNVEFRNKTSKPDEEF
ncbi:hypothetical protein CPC08DRAFT_95476 [Agrocybe pediades]|nr:hypothetical protein CPC08DRAFT_95476 [Agrocybe pediades]